MNLKYPFKRDSTININNDIKNYVKKNSPMFSLGMIENNYIISQYNIKSDKKEQSMKIINSCFGEINELSCDLYLNNKNRMQNLNEY